MVRLRVRMSLDSTVLHSTQPLGVKYTSLPSSVTVATQWVVVQVFEASAEVEVYSRYHAIPATGPRSLGVRSGANDRGVLGSVAGPAGCPKERFHASRTCVTLAGTRKWRLYECEEAYRSFYGNQTRRN